MTRLRKLGRIHKAAILSCAIIAPVSYIVWAKMNSIERVARVVLSESLKGDVGSLKSRMVKEESDVLSEKQLLAIWNKCVKPRLDTAKRTGIIDVQGSGPGNEEVICEEGLVLENGRPLPFTLSVQKTEGGPKLLVARALLTNAWRIEYMGKPGYVRRSGDVIRSAQEGLQKDREKLLEAGITHILVNPNLPPLTLDQYALQIDQTMKNVVDRQTELASVR